MIFKARKLAWVLVFIGAFGLQNKQAQGAEVFEVQGVYVDVTAENVTVARQQAMREAEERAFDILLKRMTAKADRDLLPWVEPERKAQFIRDFSVSGEKSSSVRYLATYTYHFKPDAIRDLLRSRGIAFAETFSKPVLILPLFEDSGRLSLWEEPNPWRSAWSKMQTQNGLVPLALPLGDLADISGVSSAQAYQGDEGALSAMAQRYNSESAVVAQIVVTGRDEKGEPNNVDLIVNRVGSRYAGRSTFLGIAAQSGESGEAFMKRLAGEVSETVQESWKSDNLLQFGSTEVLPVNLVIANLQEWLSVKKRLQGVAVIRKLEVALLSRDTVQLNLHFIGKLDQLISSLRQVDLDLTVTGESWALVNLGEGSRS